MRSQLMLLAEHGPQRLHDVLAELVGLRVLRDDALLHQQRQRAAVVVHGPQFFRLHFEGQIGRRLLLVLGYVGG